MNWFVLPGAEGEVEVGTLGQFAEGNQDRFSSLGREGRAKYFGQTSPLLSGCFRKLFLLLTDQSHGLDRKLRGLTVTKTEHEMPEVRAALPSSTGAGPTHAWRR